MIVPIYGVKKDSKTVYNPAKYIFPILKGREFFISNSLLDLTLTIIPLISYRKSAEVINRVRNQSLSNGTKARTLCNQIEKQGRMLRENIEEKVDNIFEKHHVVIEKGVVEVDKEDEFELKD